ncbi:hypothetical protein M3P21_04910 [Ruegeria sp. 2012CJ41-6]|uniref:Uncharacterized protein n=1 Tax=Ruegeria spongiae TaxID=2942209 RepID=A0ABT0PZ21_9RHOB|nr:hypothetical protein [Ruegeria spongiae]MCL6282866.1 hypothetical protein [Ruegeria spongiae]
MRDVAKFTYRAVNCGTEWPETPLCFPLSFHIVPKTCGIDEVSLQSPSIEYRQVAFYINVTSRAAKILPGECRPAATRVGMTMVMTTSMRFFLFAGCIGILLASFAVQMLPGVPLLYLVGLGLMGMGALGCLLVSLPQFLNPRKPRFEDAHPPQAGQLSAASSANRNAAPVSKQIKKQMRR